MSFPKWKNLNHYCYLKEVTIISCHEIFRQWSNFPLSLKLFFHLYVWIRIQTRSTHWNVSFMPLLIYSFLPLFFFSLPSLIVYFWKPIEFPQSGLCWFYLQGVFYNMFFAPPHFPWIGQLHIEAWLDHFSPFLTRPLYRGYVFFRKWSYFVSLLIWC